MLTRPAIFGPIGRITLAVGSVATVVGWLLTGAAVGAGPVLIYLGWVGLMAGYVMAPSGRVALFVLGALTWNLYFVGAPILVGLAAERGWRLLQRRRAPPSVVPPVGPDETAAPGEFGDPGDAGQSGDPEDSGDPGERPASAS